MATRKGGLGRGISALIPTMPDVTKETTPSRDQGEPTDVFFGKPAGDLRSIPGLRLLDIDVASISPNPHQPRKVFDEEDLAELVHSVKEFGVLQPIVVRPHGSGYELIMGERRLRAAKEAGLVTIPAVVKDTADENMLRDALLENLHRSNLNPLEEASAYQQLLEDFSITQEQLADRLGRSRPQVTNTLRLLRLPPDVQSKVAAGVLSSGHARALLGVGDAEKITALARKVVDEGLSVRETEALAATGSRRKTRRRASATAGNRGRLQEIEQLLEEQLDTRVRITLGRTKGQLVIDFATVSDLKRILGELGVSTTQG